ncbi:MAG: glycosyltransferase family 4 protein [Candidatus Thorarchaeota archaeon]|jgi:glycosyltransferase involved in cell wall biosynthesis
MRGGVEIFYTNIFREVINKTGWDVEVLARKSRRRLTRVFSNPLPVVTLRSIRSSFFGRLFEFIYLSFLDLILFGKSVASLLDTYLRNFDVVITPDPIVTVELCKRTNANRPVVIQFVSGAWAETLASKQPLLLKIAQKIEEEAYRIADCTIVMDQTRAYDLGLEENRYAVIPNGVNTERFDPAIFNREEIREKYKLSSQKVIVTVATLRRGIKGHDYLLNAIPKILDKIPDAHFYLLGKGNQRWINELAKSLSIENNVHILGTVEDVREMLCAGDLFILPSLSEGTPGALIEAMAMEMPCIVTRVGNVPQVIQNKKNGILINPKSSVEISDSVIEYFSNLDSYSTMGKNAREQILDHYSLKRVVEEYTAIIDKLVEQSS